MKEALNFIAEVKEKGRAFARSTRVLVCALLLAAAMAVSFSVNAEAPDISSGLVAHWTFNQGSGTTAGDSAGSRNGTLTGGPTWVTGKSGKALDFDGVDDYVEYPTNIEFNNGDFTVSGWFKREGTAGGSEDNFTIFSQRVDAAGNGNPAVVLYGRAGGGVAGVQVRDNVGAVVQVFGTTTISNDTWYHVAVTKTASEVKIYVNGVLESTGTHSLTGDFDAGATHRYIGKHSYSGADRSFSNGQIDDVRVYSRALLDEDVEALYNGTGGAVSSSGSCVAPDGDEGVMRFDPALKALVFCDGTDWVQMGDVLATDMAAVVPSGLTHYWRLDQTSGTTAFGTPGGNATLTNMDGGTDWVDGKFGKALDFDGVDDYVQTTHRFSNTNDFTISLWAKNGGQTNYVSSTLRPILSAADINGKVGGSVGRYSLAISARPVGSSPDFIHVHVGDDNSGAVTNTTNINAGFTDGAWHHIVVKREGAQAYAYHNGVQTAMFDAGVMNIGYDTVLGSAPTDSVSGERHFKGQLDDVRIYDRSLGDPEIQQLYTSSGPGCTNPDGDEGGLVYNDTHGVLQYCNSLVWVELGKKGTGGVYTPTGSGDPNDAIPSAFNFVDQTNVPLNTLTTSANITPSGYMVPVSVSVTGAGSPQISINGGAWATSGTISPGQTIAVRLTSANTPATLRSATVTIGGVSDVWNVTSLTDTTPDAFTFTDQTGVAVNTLVTSNTVTITGINYTTPVSVTGTGAQISINGGAWGTSGTITNGQTLAVRLTSSSSMTTTMTATVNVGGVTDVWSVATVAADTTPNAFTFTDVTGATQSTLVTSNPVTISGINTTTPVSVTGTGAQISINGGAWGTSGNITNGQTLEVRLTSSASFNTAMTATVTVGGVNDTWSVTTAALDTTPNAFTFTDVTNANLNALITSNTITISGINSTTPVSVSGGGAQISIAGGAWGTSGNITNGQTLAVRLTSSTMFSTAVTATVTVGGVNDTWSVTTRVAGSCASTSMSWMGNCTATVSAAASGANGTANIPNPGCGSGYYGSATYSCLDGIFTYSSGSCTAVPACDTTPNAFTFADVTGANPSTLTTATAITISGINTTTPVSVSGGGAQISINGGAWTTSGNITNGQTLAVRLTSSASFSTAANTTVTVGGVTDAWSVTTRGPNSCSAASRTWLTNCTATVSAAAHGANGTGTIANPGGCGTTWYGSGTFACSDGTFTYSSGSCTQQTACDTTPTAFDFTDLTNQNPSTLVYSNTLTISGINTTTPVSVSGTGATISINGGGWVTSGTITNGQSLRVRLTTSASFSTAMNATVNVGGVTNVWSATTRAASGCTNTTISWSNCDAASGAMTHGQTKSVTNTTAGYNGTRDLSCDDGTISQSGGSCTAATCGGTLVGGYCWYRATALQSCTTYCASRGGCNAAGVTWGGANNTNCGAIHSALGISGSSISYQSHTAYGCFTYQNARWRAGSATCAAVMSSNSGYRRMCACNN